MLFVKGGESLEERKERVLRALEEIAFTEPDLKPSERMKALELLGKNLGLWKDAEEADPALGGELSKLAELLEQRRQRREAP